MKLFVFLFACGVLELAAADELPEFRTLEGKLYKQVKVVKTTSAEIRILHADGFASIPLSQLPPEMLAKFGGKVNAMAEQTAAAERSLANAMARPSPVSSAPAAAAPAAAVAQQPQAIRADEYMAAAIAKRRMLMIAYDNGAEGGRLVEPHLVGVTTAGNWALLGWFREGASKSGQGEGWRIYEISKITAMEMVEQGFVGARPGYDAEGGGLFQSYVARLPGAVEQAMPVSASPEPVVGAGSLSSRGAQPVGRSANDPQRIAEQMARQQRQAQAAPAAGGRVMIESSIDGEFSGFEGEKVFKLLNGQVWQQIEYHINVHYAYFPRVMIYPSDGGWMMKVDGVERAVRVLPLK